MRFVSSIDCFTTRRILLPLGLVLLFLQHTSAQPKRVEEEGRRNELVTYEILSDTGPAAETTFRMLGGEATGIKHTNPIVFADQEGQYNMAFAGGGVAIGDYSGDGRPDLFIAGQLTKSSLYKQTGPMEFEDVTRRAGLQMDDHWTSGAAFADVNNDGRLDLYVCNFNSPNQLFVNQGNGTFEERASKYNLDLDRASVKGSFSDFDRDGNLDLYLVTAEPRLHVLDSHPDCETVGSGKNLRVRKEDRADCMVFNPEGFEPKIVRAGQRDHLFRNDGDQFREVTGKAGVEHFEIGNDALWCDVNDDGWPDLYVANDFTGADKLYRNNGDGTFTNILRSAVPHTPWFSMGIGSGDLNQDGLQDLITTDMAASSHELRMRSMQVMDLTDWFFKAADPLQIMRNGVFLNSTTGRFREAAFLTGMARTDWTWSTKVQDFDNDGLNDVYFTNGMVRDFVDADWKEYVKKFKGTILSKYRKRYSETENKRYLKKWKKLRQEMFRQAPERRGQNLVFQNRGDLVFHESSEEWGLDRTGFSFGAAAADLDRDGDLDLVVNNLEDPVSVYENTTEKGHGLLIRLDGRESNSYGIGAHLKLVTGQERQVRYHNPYEGFMSADEPLVHFGLGDREEIKKLLIRWPSGIRQTVSGLKANRMYTITEPQRAEEKNRKKPPAYSREKANEKGLFHRTDLDFKHRESDYDDMEKHPMKPWMHSRLGPGLAWGDVNGDGDPDLYVGGAAGQSGRLFMNRDGDLQPREEKGPWKQDADHEDMAVLWIDVNGDGHRDLFVASGSSEYEAGAPQQADRIYMNEGDGTFRKAPDEMLPDANVFSGPAAAVDYDRDGDLDLFVGGRMVPRKYPDTPRSRLLENRNGRFVDVTEEAAPALRKAGMVTSALWTDVNGDGWIDLMVTTEWGPIQYFENVNGERLAEKTNEAGLGETKGFWNGMIGTDVDEDGTMDYVVTNLGRNTMYEASKERPFRLYYGDLDGDENRELIEAYREGDTLYPFRHSSSLQHAMPSAFEQFDTVSAFAKASLSEIYSEHRLKTAETLNVNQLSSVLLRNKGDGSFEVASLPPEAQIAPGFGVVSSSFNARPGEDVFMAQNLFSVRRDTAQMDGGIGLLMRHEQKERFKPVRPGRSGVALTGDMMAAAAADVNGDERPDLAVSRNNDAPVLLKYRSGEMSPLEIRFSRPNETIAGTRVTGVVDGDVQWSREVYAGSGYLSQSFSRLHVMPESDRSEITLRVRWPDGTTSRRHVREPRGKRITLEP